MLLEGSCHCGSVAFSVESRQPLPFMRCYCSICRKTAGSGGYAVNLGADAHTLQVHKGKAQLRVYRAVMDDETKGLHTSSGQRHFCARCGTALWLFDPEWPALIHPHAGAIDTPLPLPPSLLHIMLGSKAPWVAVDLGPDDGCYDAYPDVSLAEWHRQHGLEQPAPKIGAAAKRGIASQPKVKAPLRKSAATSGPRPAAKPAAQVGLKAKVKPESKANARQPAKAGTPRRKPSTAAG